PAGGAAYDPAEKMPPKLAARLPSAEADVASRAAVQGILDELDLPPVRPPRAQTPPLRLETPGPFSAQGPEGDKAASGSPKEIRENPDKYPLRAAVLETADALRKHAGAPLHDYIGAGSAGEAAKKSILEHQREPALIFLDLKTKVERLREVGENRAE